MIRKIYKFIIQHVIPECAPVVDTVSVLAYPFLPNYHHQLDFKAHQSETVQALFSRLGYPFVLWANEVCADVGTWTNNAGLSCISAILRVIHDPAITALNQITMNGLGFDVGFIAFKSEEECFLFQLRFPHFYSSVA